MLIDLKPIGGRGSVNPEFVTSVDTETFQSGKTYTKVWVVGHMGYGTYSKHVSVSPDAARCYLENPRKYLLHRHAAKLVEVMAGLHAITKASKKNDPITVSEIVESICHKLDELAVVKAQLEELANES